MEHRAARVNDIRMHYVVAGEGPPLVLLHGWPQTWYEWRLVIPPLAERYTVIAPDLRGYGHTDKPAGGYDKRTMASDVHELVRLLGHTSIRLVGHDRGARVAHRYALDYGAEVERLVLLDIVPTRVQWERMNYQTAAAHWHWLFHLVPDLPELLVGANVKAYLEHFYHNLSFNRGAFTPEVVDTYVAAFSQPGALRAGFEDYRAGPKEDLELDQSDAGRQIEPRTLVLWGTAGKLGARSKMLDVWRECARDVQGEPVPDCGHFIPEEQPGWLVAKLLEFLGEPGPRR